MENTEKEWRNGWAGDCLAIKDMIALEAEWEPPNGIPPLKLFKLSMPDTNEPPPYEVTPDGEIIELNDSYILSLKTGKVYVGGNALTVEAGRVEYGEELHREVSKAELRKTFGPLFEVLKKILE